MGGGASFSPPREPLVRMSGLRAASSQQRVRARSHHHHRRGGGGGIARGGGGWRLLLRAQTHFGRRTFLVTHVLYYLCLFSQNIASIVATAQVMDAAVERAAGRTYALQVGANRRPRRLYRRAAARVWFRRRGSRARSAWEGGGGGGGGRRAARAAA